MCRLPSCSLHCPGGALEPAESFYIGSGSARIARRIRSTRSGGIRLNALLLLVVSPESGQQLLLGRLAGLEPAVVVSDVPAAEDEHRDACAPRKDAAEKKPSFLKGEDYLAPPPILVHMQACWDPDDCRRCSPARRAWAARLLPVLALPENEASLDLEPGDERRTTGRP